MKEKMIPLISKCLRVSFFVIVLSYSSVCLAMENEERILATCTIALNKINIEGLRAENRRLAAKGISELIDSAHSQAFSQVPELVNDTRDPETFFKGINAVNPKFLINLLSDTLFSLKGENTNESLYYLERVARGWETTELLASKMATTIKEKYSHAKDPFSVENNIAASRLKFKSLDEYANFIQNADNLLLAKWIRVMLSGPRGASRRISDTKAVKKVLERIDVSKEKIEEFLTLEDPVKPLRKELPYTADQNLRYKILSSIKGLFSSNGIDRSGQQAHRLSEIRSNEKLLESFIHELLVRIEGARDYDFIPTGRNNYLGLEASRKINEKDLVNAILIEVLGSRIEELVSNINKVEFDLTNSENNKEWRFKSKWEEYLKNVDYPLRAPFKINELKNFTFTMPMEGVDPLLRGQSFKVLVNGGDYKKLRIIRVAKEEERLQGANQEVLTFDENEVLGRQIELAGKDSPKDASYAFGPKIANSVVIEFMQEVFKQIEKNPDAKITTSGINLHTKSIPNRLGSEFKLPWDKTQAGAFISEGNQVKVWLDGNQRKEGKVEDFRLNFNAATIVPKDLISVGRFEQVKELIKEKIITETLTSNKNSDLIDINSKLNITKALRHYLLRKPLLQMQVIKDKYRAVSINTEALDKRDIKKSPLAKLKDEEPFKIRPHLEKLLEEIETVSSVDRSGITQKDYDENDFLLSTATSASEKPELNATPAILTRE